MIYHRIRQHSSNKNYRRVNEISAAQVAVPGGFQKANLFGKSFAEDSEESLKESE